MAKQKASGARLFDRLGNEPLLVLAAYNAGEKNAQRWRADAEGSFDADRTAAGITYTETFDYVQKVLATREIYRSLYAESLPRMREMVANPQAVDPSGLDPAVVEREKNVLADKFKQQGKPANVIDKIVESGLKTFYKEVCLLDQAYIRDDKKSVSQVLKEAEGKAGGPIKVAGFVRYALGEGIEKQETDFAAEVAAAAGQA